MSQAIRIVAYAGLLQMNFYRCIEFSLCMKPWMLWIWAKWSRKFTRCGFPRFLKNSCAWGLISWKKAGSGNPVISNVIWIWLKSINWIILKFGCKMYGCNKAYKNFQETKHFECTFRLLCNLLIMLELFDSTVSFKLKSKSTYRP